MKPGDLFKWELVTDQTSYASKELILYSSTMKRWIYSTNAICCCVGINANVVYWLMNNQLFHILHSDCSITRTSHCIVQLPS